MIKGRKLYLLIIVLIGWFALIAQLVVHLQNSQTSVAESLMQFFTYFTILTNILTIVCFTMLLFDNGNNTKGFFNNASIQTAITLYIAVVGLIYNLVLRQLWHSEGLQVLLHDLLHVVIPIATVIYWWLWTDARKVEWKNIPPWLVYPAVYAIVVLWRGTVVGWYPYLFLDIGKLGTSKVIVNSGLVVLVFLFFSFLFVFLGKKKPTPR